MNAWALETLVATSMLMVLVLTVRNPVARTFGPRAAYALWALPALRLVMPSLPGWRLFYVPVIHLSGEHVGAGLVDPISTARIAAEDAAAPFAPLPAPMQVETIHWQALLLGIWLGGALLWFGWQMLRYHGFLRHALRSSVLLTKECGTDVLLTPQVDGPVAAGVTTRRIFLPADFMTRYTPAERRLALLHEGAHHDRRDILANLVALVVLALHWWNPLAHRAYRAFRADQELACDATVLADMERQDHHAYGSAVLKSVSARMPGVACALSHKDEMKRRLQAMAAPRIGTRRMWIGSLGAAAAIGAGLVATASGHATAVDPDVYLLSSEIAEIRTEAADRRREERRAAEEGRRAAEEARRAAEEDRRGAEEGRRAAEEARREAMRERAAARRDAARARADAQSEAARSRADALAASREAVRAQRTAYRSVNEGARQIAATRRSMAARCAAQGRPVSPDLDWSRLALCGDTGASISARVNAQVHRQLVLEGIESRNVQN
jgi:beta-lactamase regulating signal transducer with metallopeptidase domain